MLVRLGLIIALQNYMLYPREIFQDFSYPVVTDLCNDETNKDISSLTTCIACNESEV